MSSILDDVINRSPNLTKELMIDGLYINTIESLISTALLTLEQNGFVYAQPDFSGDYETDKNITWADILLDLGYSKNFEIAKQYIAQYVQLMFDPPSSSHQAIIEKSLDHLLWRIRLGVESDVNNDLKIAEPVTLD